MFLQSGFAVNRLAITLTQDIYCISFVNSLMEKLLCEKNTHSLKETSYIINYFNSENKLDYKNVSKLLSIEQKQLFRISSDFPGYANMALNKIPYVFSKNKFSLEYEATRNKVLSYT